MNLKITAVAVAVMLTVVGGAAAVSGTTMSATNDTDATHDADVAATYDDGTVAVTVTNGGEAVENATVEVADGEYVTDANGTAVAENVSADDELTVEVEGDGFEAELEYVLQDGELTLVEEEYEYAAGDEDEREEADEEAEDDDDVEDEEAEDDDEEVEDADEDEDVDEETEDE